MDGVLPCEIFSGLGSGTMIYTGNYGKVRPMEQTDIPSVLAIMRPFIESGKLLTRTEEQLSRELADYIVYELDGGVHACAALHFYDDGQAEIAAVAVDENYAHMGIGPKLMDNLIDQAGQADATSIFIMTTQTADWFEQLGFVEDTIESLPAERQKLWTPQRNSKVFRLKK
jgi:amino-acid N-acetyltransferase